MTSTEQAKEVALEAITEDDLNSLQTVVERAIDAAIASEHLIPADRLLATAEYHSSEAALAKARFVLDAYKEHHRRLHAECNVMGPPEPLPPPPGEIYA